MNPLQHPSLHVVATASQSARQVVHVAAWQTHPGTGAWPQPLVASQVSVVQPLWSSQSTAVLPPQLPLAQCSPAVQASPSLQDAVVFAWTQVPPAHESAVHGLASSHAMGAPTQAPV